MFKLVCLLGLIAYSRALIECPPNACAVVDCAQVDASSCNGLVKPNGGWCGCCDICVTQLAEGDSCFHMFLLGVPSTVECAQGLVCDKNTMKCTAVASDEAEDVTADTPCLRKREEIRQAQENGLPLIGVTMPQCDANGMYAAVQCTGSVCYCVADDGKPVEGYSASIGELANMNCQCARDLANYMKSGLIGKLFYCDKYGNYQSSQGPATTTMKPLLSGSQTGTLLTALSTTSGACAKERLTAQSSNLLGTFVPECDADGNYIPRQCQGSECYCVRKDGSKIEGYSSPISMKDRVTCQCARDKDMYESQGLLGKIHTCRANGNYQQYQCLGSVCFCTDDNGVRLTANSVSIANINDLKCP